MSAVILRLSSVYGSGMPAKSFVHLCADRLLHGQTVELFNGGRGTADWVHVDDVAKAALSAAAANVEGHFNIGSGEATEIITVARHIAHCLGVSQDLLTVLPPDPVVPPGFGSLNIGRARRELGLHPLPLNQGLEQYCAEALAGSGTVLPQ